MGSPRSLSTLTHALKQEVEDRGWRQQATGASTVLLRGAGGVYTKGELAGQPPAWTHALRQSCPKSHVLPERFCGAPGAAWGTATTPNTANESSQCPLIRIDAILGAHISRASLVDQSYNAHKSLSGTKKQV